MAKGNYTKQKNNEEPVKVKEAEMLNPKEIMPETKEIVPVREFAKPLVSVQEAKEAFKTYQELMQALITEGDIVKIQNARKIKKSGLNKISKFFGISCEIVRAYSEKQIGPQGGKIVIWRVWAKAIAPNGQFRVAGAACSSNERRFAHLEHDVYTTAETRAKKRAIEELAGMGEYELAEDEESKKDDIPIIE